MARNLVFKNPIDQHYVLSMPAPLLGVKSDWIVGAGDLPACM